MSVKHTILVVDDDLQGLESARKILELAGYDVCTATDGQEALDLLRSSGAALKFSLILTDVRMPKLTGLEFLRALSLCGDSTPVVLMTAFGRVEDAVWAMKFGAVDFLTKPFKRQALLASVEAALKRAKPATKPQENLQRDQPSALPFIGISPQIEALKTMIAQVAPTSASVLLMGESGTGKELVARSIHAQSPRASRPFVAINCAAVPENLIEAELFGYEKGAFTGAGHSKEGLFEAAHNGTLLLDEIGDMPLTLQTKLLRALQEGEIRRVGANHSRKVNVRVIAATNRNLKEEIRAGRFREDLLYRLEVVSLLIPPLRQRREDIPRLANYFLAQAAAKHDKKIDSISSEAMAALQSHPWPGNVRELSNIIERAVVFAQTNEIQISELPPHLLDQPQNPSGQDTTASPSRIEVALGTPLREIEDMVIRKTLEATEGDKNLTAKILGINSRTIYRWLERDSDS